MVQHIALMKHNLSTVAFDRGSISILLRDVHAVVRSRSLLLHLEISAVLVVRRKAKQRSLQARLEKTPSLASLQLHRKVLLEVGVPICVVACARHKCLNLAHLLHHFEIFVVSMIVAAKAVTHLHIQKLHVEVPEVNGRPKVQ